MYEEKVERRDETRALPNRPEEHVESAMMDRQHRAISLLYKSTEGSKPMIYCHTRQCGHTQIQVENRWEMVAIELSICMSGIWVR